MLEVSRVGDVVTIEMQRAERRNALNGELVGLIRTAVLDAVSAGARAIVLTGDGPIFSAGADLSGVYAETFLTRLLDMLTTIESVPVPVISAINGGALGAGVQLAIASDLRVMSPDAFIGVPAAKLGITVDRWTIHRLVSLIGGGPARTILLGAERISAQDAFHYGFANKIGSLADAQAWAETIAGLAPLSLQHMKLVLNDDNTRGPDSDQQRAALEAAWTSADAEEGRLARQEKRPAKFVGR